MMKRFNSRRSFLKGAAGVSAATIWADNSLDAMMQYTNTASKPSEFKITDLRVATITRAPMTCPIIHSINTGGILETKKIGDALQEYGALMAMHFAGTPVSCMANTHCAATTENFLVLENHSVDVPWWGDLVDSIEKPVVNKGFVTVPDKPGLGITLNDQVMKQHLLGEFAN
jgi:L-alanine-DL-glutamate epimerase-like enolase superfamily enzyme